MTVVDKAVSDTHGKFQLVVSAENQGGAYVRRESGAPCDRPGSSSRCSFNVSTIIMDDLLEVLNFRQAVMKIDIEGHERRAFFHADRLFDNVHVGYIFMEWITLRTFVDYIFLIIIILITINKSRAVAGKPRETV